MKYLAKYARSHSDAQLAAISASDAGIGLLNDMQEKLRFAWNELQRMENESGNPLNDEQTAKAEAYFRASQRIRKLLNIDRRKLPSMITQPLCEIR